jgi:ketosteroid isomerase-like protein
MRVPLLLWCLIGCATGLCGQTDASWPADRSAIEALLSSQTAAWNRGDIPAFMHGYWESDSLVFIGSSGRTYGYAATLANYQTSYPTVADMGTLSFKDLEINFAGKDVAYVVGGWHLQRAAPKPNASGQYLLVVRRIGGVWVIVADHSS